MSQCVEKLPHECSPEHTSSDGLQVWKKEDGSYDGFCFSCGSFIPDPYSDKPEGYEPTYTERSQEDIENELKEIDELPSRLLLSRRLNKDTLEYFGVRVAVSETDGETPTAVYFPYFKGDVRQGYKIKLYDPKRIWGLGNLRDIDLFGWKQAISSGSPRIFITEGEEDAMALYQAIKKHQRGTQWADMIPAVVSLAKGSGSAKKALADNASALKGHFRDIILVFDMDDPGRQAVKEAMQSFPGAMSVNLPAKDANECIMTGRSQALAKAALFNSSAPKNTRIVNANSIIDKGREQAQMGLSWPFDQLTDITRGIRFGETYYIGAGVKMGKSDLLNALAKHFIVDHKLPVFMAKPEESNVMTLKKILGKCVGKIFHDPKVQFDYEAYDRAVALVDDRLRMLDVYQHVGWDSLRTDIIQAVQDGAKVVFIDPITNLVNGISAAETDTVLKSIAQELAAMAKDLNIAVFIFCHLKAPDSGDPHERGGKVQSYQFAGSRAMMRSCNYMMGLEGNKDGDLPDNVRNIRKLVLLEDREFGESGSVRLYWDKNTQLFNQMEARE